MKLSLFFRKLVAMISIVDSLQIPNLFGGVHGGKMKIKLMKTGKANFGVLSKPTKKMAAKMLFGKMTR